MEFSSIYWLSEIDGKTEALLLSKYKILPGDDQEGSDSEWQDTINITHQILPPFVKAKIFNC